MISRIIIFLTVFILIIGCGFSNLATTQPHPANQYFNSIEYPKIGMNQINTSTIRRNPYIINNLAKLDMVIINKSDDLFVDKNASTEYARQIKALNPKIKVLQYLSISDIWEYQDTFKIWAKQHPQVLLKDANGNYVHPYADKYGNKRYMFDSTQPAWQNYFAQRMKKITNQGMDGVFVDNLWRSNWQNLNISPEKFKQIQQGWEVAMQKGRNLTGPNKIVVGNGPPCDVYQTRDIAMLEGKLKPNKDSLDEYFKYTQDASSCGQIIYDTVQPGTYTGIKFHQATDFFLPVVLLTDNIWGFSAESEQWFSLAKKVGKIGYPDAPAKRLDNGVLSRDFTKARVLFNDTDSPKKVSLTQNTYKTINNVPINDITLQPMTGIVLKKK